MPLTFNRILHQIWTRLVFDGTPDLRPYERAVIERSDAFLGDDLSARLTRQLDDLRNCQRSSNDRIVRTLFYSDAQRVHVEHVPPHREDVEILRGTISLANPRRSSTFSVTMAQDLLCLITFSRRPDVFAAREDFVISYEPKPWRSRRDITEIVDELAHPPQDLAGPVKGHE
jgi:hypothetical protein